MKDSTNLKGIKALKTMRSTRKRSITKVKRSTFLDLYVLDKEQERLLKEDHRLNMGKLAVAQRIEEIEAEMNELKKQEREQEKENIDKYRKNIINSEGNLPQKDEAEKEWKKMPLPY